MNHLSLRGPTSPFYATHLLFLKALWLVVAISPAAHSDVILHAFNWRYAEVTANAPQIADSGYRMVLVSPPLKSSGNQWWARYQPQDYRVIDNPLGNTRDFQEMINTLKQQNIVVYSDIVLNHMANEASQRADLNYPGQAILNQYASRPGYFENLKLFGQLNSQLFSAADFHAPGCISNYDNPWQVQNLRLCGSPPDPGLPDLTPNKRVIDQQQAYLKSLKSLGVKGFRVDAAKHMSTEHINRVFTPDIKSNVHVFGEIITSGGAGTGEYDNFLKPYLQQTGHSAYDFPLFSTIFTAFKPSGSLSQLVDPLAYGQALQPQRAVTFVTTHDIPNNQGFRYLIMDPVDETLAYAYLMGRDGGVPMVFSDHNESAEQHPEDSGRWQNAYQSSHLRNMVHFHNRSQGQPMKMIAHNDCALLFTRGRVDAQGIVGINKCGFSQSFPVDTGQVKFFWFRNYRDVLDSSAESIHIASKHYSFSIPARTARMWLLE